MDRHKKNTLSVYSITSLVSCFLLKGWGQGLAIDLV